MSLKLKSATISDLNVVILPKGLRVSINRGISSRGIEIP